MPTVVLHQAAPEVEEIDISSRQPQVQASAATGSSINGRNNNSRGVVRDINAHLAPSTAAPTRVAHPGGKISSNATEATLRFAKRKRLGHDALALHQQRLCQITRAKMGRPCATSETRTLQVGKGSGNGGVVVWIRQMVDTDRVGCVDAPFESAVCLPDCKSIRPAGAARLKAASWWSGGGIMDEACRRAGFVMSMAAEVDDHHHDGYRRNFGIRPEKSNDECFRRMTNDIVMVCFGFECVSMAKNGKGEGLAHKSWADFDAGVATLKKGQYLSFHCENVAPLLTGKQFERERAHVLESFRDAGYVTIQGIADPADFGWPCTRQRCHILGLRRDVAEVVGWEKQQVIRQPFDPTKKTSPRCIADKMEQPRGRVRDEDVVDFDEFAAAEKQAHGRDWYIEWLPAFEAESQRRGMSREDTVAKRATAIMGYIRQRGKPLNRRTGFKVGSVYGLMHGVSQSEAAEGPGKNGCFYYDPLTGKTQTISLSTLRKIWDLPDFTLHKDAQVAKRQIGASAHPAPTAANSLLIALYLDRYFYLTRTGPPIPRLRLTGKFSVLTPLWQEEWSKWTEYVVRHTTLLRQGKVKGDPRPFIGNELHVVPACRGRAFDFRPCARGEPPCLVERRGRAGHGLTLNRLLHRADDGDYPDDEPYDDPGVAELTEWVGLSSGANPSMMTIACANGHMWVDDEDVGIEALEAEVALGWWEFFEFPPFWPIRVSPFFNVHQGKKVRRIHHLSKDPLRNGQAVNGQLTPYERSRLDLVRRDAIIAAIVELVRKAHLMIKGWGWTDVEIVMGWTDLKSAYNQTNIDERDLWFNCASYVTRAQTKQKAKLLIGAGLKSAFGGGHTVDAFARLTRLNNFAVARSLSRAGDDYPLQQEYRAELRRRGGRLPEGYTPLTALHLQTTGTKLVYDERVEEGDEAPEGNRYLQQWRGIDPAAQVTHPVIDRRPGASISAPTNKDLFSASTYLDDCITVALRRRKEDEGEPKCDGTDGKGSAESLRWRVRQVIEGGGYVVVNDAKSQAKWMEGMMKPVQTALGCEYDFTDPLNPLIGTTSAKRQKALQLVEDLLGSAERTLDFKQVESTVGVLGDIAQVVLRGSTHLCGFYAAMREARRGTGRVPITAWLRRNLRWWQRYLHSGAPKQRLLVCPPAQPKKFCPHTDASTSWGYGGFWITGGTCYYIQGEWTAEEKKLIDDFDLGINFLEAATCGFLLEVAKGNFEGKSMRFYCDNQCSVRIMTSYKTRTLGLAKQLELVDLNLSQHDLRIDFVWIATEDNKESDALSRGALDEFIELIHSRYGVYDIVHLQVPPEARDLSECVRGFREHPEWCVADGKLGAAGSDASMGSGARSPAEATDFQAETQPYSESAHSASSVDPAAADAERCVADGRTSE